MAAGKRKPGLGSRFFAGGRMTTLPPAMSPLRWWIRWLCARPREISWGLCAASIWLPMTLSFAASGVFSDPFSDWTLVPLMVLSYAAAFGLGFLLGPLVFGIAVVFPLRRAVNGSSWRVGDSVLIMKGAYEGRVGVVCGSCMGQGQTPLYRVDMGVPPEGGDRVRFCDFLEPDELVRNPCQAGLAT